MKSSALVGVLMGGLYGVTLWASLDAFSLASKMLYGNIYIIPFVTTDLIMCIAFVCLWSYERWVSFFEDLVFDWEWAN